MSGIIQEILSYKRSRAKRKTDNIFLVEGEKMFFEIPSGRLKKILCTDRYFQENRGKLESFGVPVFSVRDYEYARISDTQTPQGIMGVVEAYTYTPEEVLSDASGVYVLLENLQDPGNVGTIFRSAEAAGAAGILLDDTTCDPLSQKVVRASMGAIFRMKFAILPSVREGMRLVREKNGTVYATALTAEKNYTACDYKKMTGFIIGNESKGLTPETIREADVAIRIPMEGQVESLNAAMATTILLYEAHRQRNIG